MEGKVSTREHPHFWHQLQFQRIPKTILSFDDLLEGLKVLIESYYTHGYYGLLQG